MEVIILSDWQEVAALLVITTIYTLIIYLLWKPD